MEVFYQQFTFMWRRHGDDRFGGQQDLARAIDENRVIAGSARTWAGPASGENQYPVARTQSDTLPARDCLRGVHHSNDDGFEYDGQPALSAPRPRLERGTYCLGGTFEVWPDAARHGLKCRFAEVILAGRCLV
jgi:hypothetical protein